MRRFSLSLIVGLLFSGSAFADAIQDIQKLNDNGSYSEAYDLAQTLLDQYEGDPGFDLQYGVAAIENGKVSEGVFALERVLFLDPKNALAKLELARGYFLLGQFEKSKSLFNKVKSSNPPPAVLARIEQFLSQIDKKTTVPPTKFSGFAELWAGHDSNINSGPGGQTNVVTLSDNALGRGDQYNQVRINGSIDHSYSPTNSLRFSANADLRYYHTEPEQDYKNLTLTGSHLWKLENQQFHIGGTVQHYQLNLEDYRTLLGFNGSWSKQLSNRSVLKSFASLNNLTYDQLSWKDSTQITAGVNYLYAGKGNWQPLYFLGAFVGDESPKVEGILANGQVDRIFFGGNAGIQFTPFSDLRITPAITYQGSRFQGEDWIYNKKRDDDFITFNLNMEWAFHPAWALLANYSFTDVSSNIELYEYDRQQVMFGLRYSFQ